MSVNSRYYMWVASADPVVMFIRKDLITEKQICYDSQGKRLNNIGAFKWRVGETINWITLSEAQFRQAISAKRGRGLRK